MMSINLTIKKEFKELYIDIKFNPHRYFQKNKAN